MRTSTTLSLFVAGLAAAREVPANLKSFYDGNINGNCPNPISIQYSSTPGKTDTVYCQDSSTKAVYLKTVGSGYADMDIDCDGANNGAGKCSNDPSGQGQTAFQDQVREYSNNAIKDLDSSKHTFVVLGNDNSKEEGDGGKPFDPQNEGIKPLSVVAVVCNNKLVYGVWGDVNGGKLTGEASISLAEMCFPNEGLSGDNGHGKHDVLYMAFPGEEAVAKDAAWDANNAQEFEQSLAKIGDQLVAKVKSGKTSSRIMRGRL